MLALLKRARRSGEPLALVAADLDGLKIVNDRDGHLEGDLALRTFAEADAALYTAKRAGGDRVASAATRSEA